MNQFSIRTFLIRYSFFITLCFLALKSNGNTLIQCVGATGSYNSGSVTSSGVVSVGNMTNIYNTGSRGWARFDLSSIPPGAVVTAVNMVMTVYSISSSTIQNYVYGFTGDPAGMTGTALYNACGSGSFLDLASWSAGTFNSLSLNATGVAFIQANLGNSNVNLSFVRGSSSIPFNIYGYGTADAPKIAILYTLPCGGALAPGNTISSGANCIGSNVTLSLQNPPQVNNVTYQWYKNNVAIPGATFTNYFYTMTSSASYHCAVTCVNSGITTNSTPLLVSPSPYYNCYCTSSVGGNCTLNQISNFSISPSTLNNNATCTSPYQLFSASGPTTAQLQIGNTYAFNVKTQGIGTPSQIGFWIDYNHNSSYESSEFTRIDSFAIPSVLSTINLTIPTSALSGTTGMRVRSSWTGSNTFTSSASCAAFSEGNTQDYLINLVSPTSCTGLPSTIQTIANDTSICYGSQAFLSLNTNLSGNGISYQWYTNGSIIPGATNSIYQFVINSSSTYYCNITCAGNTVSSTPRTIEVAHINCYCSSIPAFNNDADIYQVTLNGNSTNPTYSNSNNCTNIAPGPGSILSRYANFSTVGNLSTINLGTSTTFEVRLNECSGAPYYSTGVGVWIDYNHNGSFADPGETIYKDSELTAPINTSPIGDKVVLGSFIVPTNAMLGQTAMRVIAAEGYYSSLDPCLSYNYGETEDYVINIIPGNACTGTPQLGQTISSANNLSMPSRINLTTQYTPNTSGITYQWYNSSGVIPGATNNFYSVVPSQREVFYCLANCGGNIGSSTPLIINVNYGSSPFNYCLATNIVNTSGCLTSVSINGVANTSTCPPAGNNYQLFPTPFATTLNKGTTYACSAAMNMTGSVSMWIDFNRNGVFEAIEWTQIIANNATGGVSFAVPSNAIGGLTAMRVRSRLPGSPNGSGDACIAMGSGETEDYWVNIAGGPSCAPTVTHQTISSCNSYTWPSTGLTYYASGNYFKTTPKATNAFCRDTTYLHLNLNESTTISNVNACTSYTWPLNGITYTTNGTYTQTLTTSSGCDSVVGIQLNINQTNSGSSSVTACNTYTWNGVTYTNNATPSHVYTNSNGCDSLHTLSISITQGPIRTVSASAINSYTWSMNNQTYTTTGTYFTYITNPAGCDSVIYLDLTIYPVSVEMRVQNIVQISPTIVEYDVYLENTSATTIALQGYSFGMNHATGMRGTGTLTHTLVSRDPVFASFPSVTVGYTASTNHLRFIASNVSAGNEYNLVQGASIRIATMRMTNSVAYPTDFNPVFALQTLTATGKTQCIANAFLPTSSTAFAINGIGNSSLSGTLQALTGDVIAQCIYLNPSGTLAATNSNITNVVCYGQSTGSVQITLSGLGSAAPAGTSGTYTIDGGINLNYSSNPFTVSNLSAGTHTISIKTSYGCTVTKTVTISQPSSPATSSFSGSACVSYTWNGVTYTASGVYQKTYTTAQGCDSVRTLNLTIHPLPIVTASNVTRCIGSSVNLVGSPAGGTFSIANPYSGPSTSYTYTYTNSFGCSATSSPASVTVTGCDAVLNLHFYLQGYYIGGGNMQPALMNQGVSNDPTISDTVLVEIRSSNSPFNLITSQKTLLQTNGNLTCTFPFTGGSNLIGTSNYIVIKHRSGLNTWSAAPISFATNNTTYNFSNAASKAYGANQIELEPGVWGFYNGDLNHDENIDLIDNPILENDINNFEYGYFPTDLNGDGNVDLVDVPILEWSIYNFIYSLHP